MNRTAIRTAPTIAHVLNNTFSFETSLVVPVASVDDSLSTAVDTSDVDVSVVLYVVESTGFDVESTGLDVESWAVVQEMLSSTKTPHKTESELAFMMTWFFIISVLVLGKQRLSLQSDLKELCKFSDIQLILFLRPQQEA